VREHLAWLALATACTQPRSVSATISDSDSVSVPVSVPVSASDSASASASDSYSAPDSASDSDQDAGVLRSAGTFGIVITRAPSVAPILYLHGKWASPEDSCSFFERAVIDASPSTALICPRGNLPSSSGGGWGGALIDERRSLDDALAAARALTSQSLSEPGIVMGFSSGAAFAVKLALAEPGRFAGVVLMSMVLQLDASKLKAAGVKRVVLMAGELDASHASMVANAKALNAGGLETRFVSLGKVGHHFAADMETRMVDVVAWVRGG
jgi:predicted esterase